MADERIEANQEVISDSDPLREQFMALFWKMPPKEKQWFVELIKVIFVNRNIRRARRFARKLGVLDLTLRTLKASGSGRRKPGVSAGHSNAAAPASLMGGAA